MKLWVDSKIPAPNMTEYAKMSSLDMATFAIVLNEKTGCPYELVDIGHIDDGFGDEGAVELLKWLKETGRNYPVLVHDENLVEQLKPYVFENKPKTEKTSSVDDSFSNASGSSEQGTGPANKEFNPFYDSDFLISREGLEEHRMLVELFEDELIQLRDECNILLERVFGHQISSVDNLISEASGRSEQSKGLADDLDKFRDGLDMTD